MNRRTLLASLAGLALYPLESHARKKHQHKKKRHKKPQVFAELKIVDHTTPEWEDAIKKALVKVNALLPACHPPLVYVRGEPGPLPPGGKKGEVSIWLVRPEQLRNQAAAAESWYPTTNFPGNAARILIRYDRPPSPILIMHELHHCLTGQAEHTGWQDSDTPFDASLISCQ